MAAIARQNLSFSVGDELAGEIDASGRWVRIDCAGQPIPLIGAEGDSAREGGVSKSVASVRHSRLRRIPGPGSTTPSTSLPIGRRPGYGRATAASRGCHSPWSRPMRPPAKAGGTIPSPSRLFEAGPFSLSTDWTTNDAAVRIDGRLRAEDHGEHACLLRMSIPWAVVPEMRWWNRLGDACGVEPGKEYSQTLVPIAAACDGRAGLALAVPPDSPCYFLCSYSDQVGLSITLRLGISAGADSTHATAGFSLLLMRTDGHWGFRDALRRYYELFPEYYNRRTDKYGLWYMGRAGDYPDPSMLAFGEIGEDFDSQTTHAHFMAIAADNAKAGQLTFPYTIVGTTHIAHRPRLPKTSAEAIRTRSHPPSGVHLLARRSAWPRPATRTRKKCWPAYWPARCTTARETSTTSGGTYRRIWTRRSR